MQEQLSADIVRKNRLFYAALLFMVLGCVGYGLSKGVIRPRVNAFGFVPITVTP